LRRSSTPGNRLEVTRWVTRHGGIVWADGSSRQPKEQIMPLVNVRLIEGVFTPEQKREIIHGVTEAMVAVEGEALRGVTWVVLEEVHSGDWGIGGKGLTTADVHALQGHAPARAAG
jgi:4-oxalocrotonate tautomerase